MEICLLKLSGYVQIQTHFYFEEPHKSHNGRGQDVVSTECNIVRLICIT